MKRANFIFEPTEDKYGRIHELYVFTRDGYDQKCYCNQYTANVYKAENVLLDILEKLPIMPILRKEIEKAIENYGEARSIETREDVEEGFAERDSGASLSNKGGLKMIMWTFSDNNFCVQLSQSGEIFEIKIDHDSLIISPIGKSRYHVTTLRDSKKHPGVKEMVIQSLEHNKECL